MSMLADPTFVLDDMPAVAITLSRMWRHVDKTAYEAHMFSSWIWRTAVLRGQQRPSGETFARTLALLRHGLAMRPGDDVRAGVDAVSLIHEFAATVYWKAFVVASEYADGLQCKVVTQEFLAALTAGSLQTLLERVPRLLWHCCDARCRVLDKRPLGVTIVMASAARVRDAQSRRSLEDVKDGAVEDAENVLTLLFKHPFTRSRTWREAQDDACVAALATIYAPYERWEGNAARRSWVTACITLGVHHSDLSLLPAVSKRARVLCHE